MSSEGDLSAESQDTESRPQSPQPTPPAAILEDGEEKHETCSQPYREAHGEELKFKDLSQQNKSLQEQNNQLQEHIKLLQEKLDQYDADRLDDEPEDPITDRSAKSSYQDILRAIEQWIYSVTSNPKVLPWQENPHKYHKHIISQICQAVSTEEFVAYEFAEFFILTRLILQRLDKEIFQDFFPIGLHVDQRMVLDQAMHGMNAAGDCRDTSRMHKWKVQACEALMRYENFEGRLQHEIGGICDDMGKELKHWLASPKEFDKHRDALVEEIITEAVHLQHKLSLSAQGYRFHFADLPPRKALDSSLLDCELRDVDTWRQPDNNHINDGVSKPFPTVLGELSPSLTRAGPDNKSFSVMKPIMVIATSHVYEKARTERTFITQELQVATDKWTLGRRTFQYKRTPK